MAAEAGEKLPAPELTVIAAALDGLAPPVTSNRDEQMRALWEGCIASLTEWTSRAFLLQGGSGSGKTTCVENLLYRLRLISKDLKAQANCRIDIVELDIAGHRVNPVLWISGRSGHSWDSGIPCSTGQFYADSSYREHRYWSAKSRVDRFP
ncbi:hypothetical protein ACLB2K_070710 [Fragaria x ananassa]